MRTPLACAMTAVSFVALIACTSEMSTPLTPSAVISDGSAAIRVAPLACVPGDTADPVISSVSATPNSLWPPNHKWWTVRVGYTVSDASTVSCSLAVTSDEPINGIGDGNTAPDWQVIDDHTVRLRAERAGPGNGRTYTVTITCTDACGNTAEARTRVQVVHDQGRR